MRSLATALGVSPKALYNYVADRQDLLLLVALLAESDWPTPRLDARTWQSSLRSLCHRIRLWHRRYPGVLEMVQRENVHTRVHPRPMQSTNAMLGFFLDLGLSEHDAYRAWALTTVTIAGFAELHDRWHDRPPPAGVEADRWDGVPDDVIRQHESLDLTHLRQVMANVTPDSPDTLFEALVDMLLAGIAAMIPAGQPDRA